MKKCEKKEQMAKINKNIMQKSHNMLKIDTKIVKKLHFFYNNNSLSENHMV